MKNFKKGDKVVMHTCFESEQPEYAGKVWTCRTDSYIDKSKDEIVFWTALVAVFYAIFFK